jgi:hypothetical protein
MCFKTGAFSESQLLMPTIIFMILTRSDLFTFVKKCAIRLAKHLSKMIIVDPFRFENTLFSKSAPNFFRTVGLYVYSQNKRPQLLFTRSLLFERSNIMKGTDLKGKLLSYLMTQGPR